MTNVFVSYRRQDSSGHAGRIQERLRSAFGKRNVFVDVENIDPGINFVEAIEKAITKSKVVLAVIGPDWVIAKNQQDRRRIDDPEDFVRLEIEQAFQHKTKVIPVLVRGATMPDAEELPKSLQELAKTQALEIRDSRWDADMAALLREIGGPRLLRIIRRNKWNAAIFLVVFPVVMGLVFYLTQGPVDSAERFLTLIAQGKMQEAYRATTFTTQQQMDEQTFAREIKRLRLHDNASASWSSRSIGSEGARLDGKITTKQREVIPVTIILRNEDGEWKVVAIKESSETHGPRF